MSETVGGLMGKVLELRKVALRHQDHLDYGPLELTLEPGQGALVVCGGDLELLRRLMRCCQGLEEPTAGSVSWWPGALSREGLWPRYDFYRQIGYLDRQVQLLRNLTLKENLLLPQQYAGQAGGRRAVLEVLDVLGLAQQENQRAGDLAEPVRRLGLYALALSQRPKLLLMERPVQFLDRDFDRVWDFILRQAADRGLAYAVFDRTRTLYAADHFNHIAGFSPGPG